MFRPRTYLYVARLSARSYHALFTKVQSTPGHISHPESVSRILLVQLTGTSPVRSAEPFSAAQDSLKFVLRNQSYLPASVSRTN